MTTAQSNQSNGGGGLRNAVATFLALPSDIHASILSYLPIPTLLRSRTVSKQWKAITSSQALWNLIARRAFGERPLFHGRMKFDLGWEWICLAHLIRFQNPPLYPTRHPFTSLCPRDRSNYIGDWIRGKRDGFGMSELNGIIMIGEWREDVPHGDMVKLFPRGERTEGTYINGDFVRGTKFFGNGDRYTGEFKDFQMDGEGTYIWANGDRYTGAWRRHQAHGFGVNVWADGRKYEGFFQAGVPHGRGTFNWPDGARYSGEWEFGLRSGRGEMFWSNGEKLQCRWSSDQHDLLEKVMSWDGFFLLESNLRAAKVKDYMEQLQEKEKEKQKEKEKSKKKPMNGTAVAKEVDTGDEASASSKRSRSRRSSASSVTSTRKPPSTKGSSKLRSVSRNDESSAESSENEHEEEEDELENEAAADHEGIPAVGSLPLVSLSSRRRKSSAPSVDLDGKKSNKRRRKSH